MKSNERVLNRLVSLDLFRGLVMFLLVAEGAGLYHTWLEASQEGTFMHALASQFHHGTGSGSGTWCNPISCLL